MNYIVDVNISAETPNDQMWLKLEALAYKLARLWHVAQGQNQFGHYHLYCKRSAVDVTGQLRIASEGEVVIENGTPVLVAPDGFELADPTRFSPGWTVDQAKAFIFRISKGLEILGHPRKGGDREQRWDPRDQGIMSVEFSQGRYSPPGSGAALIKLACGHTNIRKWSKRPTTIRMKCDFCREEAEQ
ncbi:MAG: hypothetical protein MOB07_31435 [Acidobacteria bacterium]|nr:hypothetical protein [Acidobacteriota bacterium]